MTHDMQNRLSDLQRKYLDELMSKPNVVGIGIGLAQKNGDYTEELALVVMVSKKVPLGDIDEADRIPATLEGLPVDVQEVGDLQAF